MSAVQVIEAFIWLMVIIWGIACIAIILINRQPIDFDREMKGFRQLLEEERKWCEELEEENRVLRMKYDSLCKMMQYIDDD